MGQHWCLTVAPVITSHMRSIDASIRWLVDRDAEALRTQLRLVQVWPQIDIVWRRNVANLFLGLLCEQFSNQLRFHLRIFGSCVKSVTIFHDILSLLLCLCIKVLQLDVVRVRRAFALHERPQVIDVGVTILLKVVVVQLLVKVVKKFTLLCILQEVIWLVFFLFLSDTIFGKEIAQLFLW